MIQTNEFLQHFAQGVMWLAVAAIIVAIIYMGLSCGDDDDE